MVQSQSRRTSPTLRITSDEGHSLFSIFSLSSYTPCPSLSSDRPRGRQPPHSQFFDLIFPDHRIIANPHRLPYQPSRLSLLIPLTPPGLTLPLYRLNQVKTPHRPRYILKTSWKTTYCKMTMIFWKTHGTTISPKNPKKTLGPLRHSDDHRLTLPRLVHLLSNPSYLLLLLKSRSRMMKKISTEEQCWRDS